MSIEIGCFLLRSWFVRIEQIWSTIAWDIISDIAGGTSSSISIIINFLHHGIDLICIIIGIPFFLIGTVSIKRK